MWTGFLEEVTHRAGAGAQGSWMGVLEALGQGKLEQARQPPAPGWLLPRTQGHCPFLWAQAQEGVLTDSPVCPHWAWPCRGLAGNERWHPVSRPVPGSQEGGGQDQVPTLYPSPPWTLESVQTLSSGVKQEAKRGCI